MQGIPDKSIDMILCDLPYGTTACKWDTIIPFVSLWEAYRRIIKDNGAVVLTASQPFTSALVMSNPDMFKYEIIWHKSQATGHLNAKKMPMREHESILIFGIGKLTYNAQIQKKEPKNIRPLAKDRDFKNRECYGKFKDGNFREIPLNLTYPRSVIKINNTNHGERGLHPTQKPVALFEYLIKTYTNPGDVVLDNCSGSGTTAIACINTQRNYIYYSKSVERVENTKIFIS
jgi:site-specific DNA-methyltransferase (adenine-specific)